MIGQENVPVSSTADLKNPAEQISTQPNRPIVLPQTESLVAPCFIPDSIVQSYQGLINSYCSQDFCSPEGFDDFDCEAADDFLLTEERMIRAASVMGSGANPDTLVIRIYDDNGGKPGSLVFEETFPGLVDFPVTTVNFTNCPTLAPGTYWLSAVAQQCYIGEGQWFWVSTNDNYGQTFHWRNPGQAIDANCPDWEPYTTCLVAGGSGLVFSIQTCAAETPEEFAGIPTLSQWGLFLFGLIFFTMGFVVVYQRKLQTVMAGSDLSMPGSFRMPWSIEGIKSALRPAIGLGVLGLIIIQLGWGEITGLDVLGTGLTVVITAYLIQLLNLIKK